MKPLSYYLRGSKTVASQIVVPAHIRIVSRIALHDYQLLVFSNEEVGRRIWLFKTFEAEETKLFSNIVKPEDVRFDIGGNIGYFSMLLSARAKQGHVHVFEPIPINAALINASKELNSFNNVTINHLAVGDGNGTVSFSDSANSSLMAKGRTAEARNISVPILRIADYLPEKRISHFDIIKVEVEGAENIVIDGAKGLLTSKLKKTCLELLQLFDENLKPFGSSVAAIVEKMRVWGCARHVTSLVDTLRPFLAKLQKIYPNLIFKPV
jgi:FkbM family methyltransferase